MHKNLEKIKKLESPPKILKNFIAKKVAKISKLYENLPITVHNKKQM